MGEGEAGAHSASLAYFPASLGSVLGPRGEVPGSEAAMKRTGDLHLWPPVETGSAVLVGSRCERLPLSLMVITSDKQDKCEVISPAGRSEGAGFRAPRRLGN